MNSNLERINELVAEKNTIILKELDEIREIMLPQTIFSKGAYDANIIHAYYVSDIHLEQHLSNEGIDIDDTNRVIAYFDKILRKMVPFDIAKELMKLSVSGTTLLDLFHSYEHCAYLRYIYRYLKNDEYDEMLNKIAEEEVTGSVAPIISRFVVFDGDVSTNVELSKLFFDRFLLRLKYCRYINWKVNHDYIRESIPGLSHNDAVAKYNNRLHKLEYDITKKTESIRKIERRIGKNILKYYLNKDQYEIIRLIEARKDIPDYVGQILFRIKDLQEEKEEFLEERDSIISYDEADSFHEFENKLDKVCPIYYVLGNHECYSFQTVDDAVETYRYEYAKSPVTIIHNEIVEYSNCIILGGTGFAQYNDRYNADTLICPKKMMHNREYEIQEGAIFEGKYQEALALAKEKSVPLIVLAHYPFNDWSSTKTDGQCYYFTGHTHNNMVNISDNGTIYADNQIGYTSNKIVLRKYPIGTMRNPFIDYEDGIHVITPQQYLDFYLYNGETIGVGKIERSIKSGNTFYMIKRNGFYSFFIVTKKNMQICAGGNNRKISEITDINYIYNCFIVMVYQYVLAMKPYRKFQELISAEIKKLDIPAENLGRIHGCIVDVDFTHHIMINPIGGPDGKGKITFYYSPMFGIVREYENIERLLASVEEKSPWLLNAKGTYIESKQRFLKDKNNVLLSFHDTNLIGEMKSDLVVIDISDSIYPASERLNQLQRLFTANILRDWDQNIIGSLIEIEDVDAFALEEKFNKLNPYQKVQKHWKNLLLIDPEKINVKLVQCALDKKRKCEFPFQTMEKCYGYELPDNPMNDDELKEYIRHIPTSILTETLEEFEYFLGMDILKYYPLDIIPDTELKRLFEQYALEGKKLVEILNYIGEERWPQLFGALVSEALNPKRRPAYCSTELWEKIRSYDK